MSGAPVATCGADIEDRDTVAAVAEEFERSVMHVDTPDDARVKLNPASCALVILNAQTGDADSRKVCRDWKAAHPEVPIVMCAPTDDVDTKLDLLGEGADQFLVTPIEEEALRFVLRFYLVEKGR